MLRLIAPIAAIALAMLSASPAMAAPRDTDVPQPDPSRRWRTIAQTDEESSSKCIGNPITPICAVETELACWLRARLKLCQMAWHPEYPRHPIIGLPYPNRYDRYRIVFAMRIHDIDLAEPRRRFGGSPLPYNSQAGDILIDLQIRRCRVSAGCHRIFVTDSPRRFVVRRAADYWRLV